MTDTVLEPVEPETLPTPLSMDSLLASEVFHDSVTVPGAVRELELAERNTHLGAGGRTGAGTGAGVGAGGAGGGGGVEGGGGGVGVQHGGPATCAWVETGFVSPAANASAMPTERTASTAKMPVATGRAFTSDTFSWMLIIVVWWLITISARNK